MAYRTKLRGNSGELARRLQPGMDPSSILSELRRIHQSSPVLLTEILGRASCSLADIGLTLSTKTSRLEILPRILTGTSEVAGVNISDPVELARAISKARKSPKIIVDRSMTGTIVGYDQQIKLSSIHELWRDTATSPEKRIELMRCAASISNAEISVMQHNGLFGDESNGLATIQNHSGRLVDAMSSPATQSDSIRWGVRCPEVAAIYTLGCADSDGQTVTTIIGQEVVGEAIEIGAALLAEDKSTSYPKRQFDLASTTVFAVNPSQKSLFGDGSLLNVPGSDPSTMLALALSTEDTTVLAPAYTCFTLSQSLIQ